MGIDMKATGNLIKEYAENCGYKTATVLANTVGVTPMAVYKWYNGIAIPSIDRLVELSELFACPIDTLIVKEI